MIGRIEQQLDKKIIYIYIFFVIGAKDEKNLKNMVGVLLSQIMQ